MIANVRYCAVSRVFAGGPDHRGGGSGRGRDQHPESRRPESIDPAGREIARRAGCRSRALQPLLDTIRQYASAKARSGRRDESVLESGIETISSSIAELLARQFGEEQARSFAHLDRELGQRPRPPMPAALDDPVGGGERALRLVYAIKAYYYNRGLLGLALRITSEALEHPGASARNPVALPRPLRCGSALLVHGPIRSRPSLPGGKPRHRARDRRRRTYRGRAATPAEWLRSARGDHAAAHRYSTKHWRWSVRPETSIRSPPRSSPWPSFTGSSATWTPRSRCMPRPAKSRTSSAITKRRPSRFSISRWLRSRAKTRPKRGCSWSRRCAISMSSTPDPSGKSLIEVSAGLAALRARVAQSARYPGLSEALAQQIGIHRDPADEAFLAPRIAATREAMGNDALRHRGCIGPLAYLRRRDRYPSEVARTQRAVRSVGILERRSPGSSPNS